MITANFYQVLTVLAHKKDATKIRIQFVTTLKDDKLEIDFSWTVYSVDEKLPFFVCFYIRTVYESDKFDLVLMVYR